MSDKEYVPLWLSYTAYFEPLSAAEVGRLAMAMITYKSSGAEPKLDGNERFVWPAIRRDIDNAEQYKSDLSDTRRKSGRQGGLAKVANAKFAKQNIANPSKSSNDNVNENDNVNVTKEKINKKEKCRPISASGEFDGRLLQTVEEWLRYKHEKGDKYTQTGAQKLFTQIRNNVSKYGENAVIDVINRSMAANYQVIVFNWLAKEQNRSKTATELQGTQSSDAPTNADIERMQRLMQSMKDTKG